MKRKIDLAIGEFHLVVWSLYDWQDSLEAHLAETVPAGSSPEEVFIHSSRHAGIKEVLDEVRELRIKFMEERAQLKEQLGETEAPKRAETINEIWMRTGGGAKGFAAIQERLASAVPIQPADDSLCHSCGTLLELGANPDHPQVYTCPNCWPFEYAARILRSLPPGDYRSHQREEVARLLLERAVEFALLVRSKTDRSTGN